MTTSVCTSALGTHNMNPDLTAVIHFAHMDTYNIGYVSNLGLSPKVAHSDVIDLQSSERRIFFFFISA